MLSDQISHAVDAVVRRAGRRRHIGVTADQAHSPNRPWAGAGTGHLENCLGAQTIGCQPIVILQRIARQRNKIIRLDTQALAQHAPVLGIAIPCTNNR